MEIWQLFERPVDGLFQNATLIVIRHFQLELSMRIVWCIELGFVS